MEWTSHQLRILDNGLRAVKAPGPHATDRRIAMIKLTGGAATVEQQSQRFTARSSICSATSVTRTAGRCSVRCRRSRPGTLWKEWVFVYSSRSSSVGSSLLTSREAATEATSVAMATSATGSAATASGSE